MVAFIVIAASMIHVGTINQMMKFVIIAIESVCNGVFLRNMRKKSQKGLLEMTDKLKPCPFCGGEAEFANDHKILNQYGVRLMCTGKHCCAAQVGVDKTVKEAKIKAIDRWNKRSI